MSCLRCCFIVVDIVIDVKGSLVGQISVFYVAQVQAIVPPVQFCYFIAIVPITDV